MIGLRTLLLFAYVVVGCLPLLLVRLYPIRRDKPGGTGLVIILVGSSLWSFGTVVGMLASTMGIRFAAGNLVMLGASLSAIGWFIMIAEYTGLLAPRRRVLGLLALEPVLLQAIAWSPLHVLIFGSGGNPGPVFWIHTVIAYGLVLVGIIAIVDVILDTSGLRRRQGFALLCSAIPPAGVEFLNIFFYGFPFPPTPLAYGITICIIAWALFGTRFLDLVPIARERVLDTMSDPVVVVDDDGRILESNPAAREFVGIDGDHVGMSCEEFFAEFPDAVEQIGSKQSGTEEISVRNDGTEYYFDVEISPIKGPNRQRTGRVFVFRQITRLKRQERELRERERELDLMRQVQSRVLRHNIRNDLTVVKGYNEVFAEELDDEYADMAEIVIEKADDLISISHKARTVEELVEQDQTPAELDLGTMLTDLVETHRERFPEVTFTLDCPAECRVVAAPAVKLCFENLLENAAEHNDAATPTVDVTLVDEPDGTVVTISDNGPGVPEQELSVLDEGEETSLEHGSGIGLWIVEWIVDRTSATIDYETGSHGTTVTVRIPD